MEHQQKEKYDRLQYLLMLNTKRVKQEPDNRALEADFLWDASMFWANVLYLSKLSGKFQEKLRAKLTEKEFEGVEFKLVMPLTLIDIDSLILYRANFEKGEIDLFELLEGYQQYVKFDAVEEKMDEKFGRAIVPFSYFIKSIIDKNNFKVRY